MKISKRADDAIPSTISLHDFGRAMAQLDLATVPPHKRAAAIIDHLARIQSETMVEPNHREAIALARSLHQKRRLQRLGLIIAHKIS